jgi:hypothetical protein
LRTSIFLLLQPLQQFKDGTGGGRALTSRPLHHAAGPSTNCFPASMETGEGGPAPMEFKRRRTNLVAKSEDGAAVAESEWKVQGMPVTRAPACLDSTPATVQRVYVALFRPSGCTEKKL